MLKVAVDLGYGYVKAVSEKARVLFPSVLAPAVENPIDLGGGFARSKHYVELRGSGSLKQNKFYVGDLAILEGRAAQITLARERFARDTSLSLVATGAYLAGAEGRIALGIGVPLAYYRHQRYEVQKVLQDMSVYASVDGGPEKPLIFSNVYVFPQGVGALFGGSLTLPMEGLIGLIDIGYHTTDYLLAELKDGAIEPLASFMSSVEIGVHTAQKVFAGNFHKETGKPLALVEAQSFWPRKEITFDGRKVNIEPMTAFARTATGQAIAETVMAAWAEKMAFLDAVYLAGGGALEFSSILQKHMKAEVVLNPQFANANGFYHMTGRALAHGQLPAAEARGMRQ